MSGKKKFIFFLAYLFFLFFESDTKVLHVKTGQVTLTVVEMHSTISVTLLQDRTGTTRTHVGIMPPRRLDKERVGVKDEDIYAPIRSLQLQQREIHSTGRFRGRTQQRHRRRRAGRRRGCCGVRWRRRWRRERRPRRSDCLHSGCWPGQMPWSQSPCCW